VPGEAAVDFGTDRRRVDAELATVAARYLAGVNAAVRETVHYALSGEGKRLRYILLLAAYRAAGGARDATTLAAAVEIVHAYSLVHDDLPCMDDDDVRRGRPTAHRAYGIRTATAAGLVMVPLAARAAYDGARNVGLHEREAGAVVRELMQASGAAGMIGGQLLDLEGEQRPLSLGQLENVHSRKTGALIAASVRIGALAASAPARALDALSRYGRAVGLAFQIADDVLDVTATTDQLGKTAGRDAALHKSTYPALLGVEGARERASALCEAAVAALRDGGVYSDELRDLGEFSIRRSR
jgi:geranylgeranyl pyrophosphate synthase